MMQPEATLQTLIIYSLIWSSYGAFKLESCTKLWRVSCPSDCTLTYTETALKPQPKNKFEHLDFTDYSGETEYHEKIKHAYGEICTVVKPKGLTCDQSTCGKVHSCNGPDSIAKYICMLKADSTVCFNKLTYVGNLNVAALCGAAVTIDTLPCFRIAFSKPTPNGSYAYGCDPPINVVVGETAPVLKQSVTQKAISRTECNMKTLEVCAKLLREWNVDFVARCKKFMPEGCSDENIHECQHLEEFTYHSKCESLCTDFNTMKDCWEFREKIGANKDDKYDCTKFYPTSCADATKQDVICDNYEWGEKCSQLRGGASLVDICNYAMPHKCFDPAPPSNCEHIWGPQNMGKAKKQTKSSSNVGMILLCVGLVLSVLLLALCMGCFCCLIVRVQKRYMQEKEEATTLAGGTSRRQGDATMAETLRSTVQIVRAKPNASSRLDPAPGAQF